MLAGQSRSSYKPRRANLSTWLKGAPEWVLDVFHHEREAHPYSVYLTHTWRVNEHAPHSPSNTMVDCLYVSDDGTDVQSDSGKAWQVTRFRYQNARRHRIAWEALPVAVRHAVTQHLADEA